MNAADAAVLVVLAPSGMLTAHQIQRGAQLTSWSVRRAIGRLESRGLITASPIRARWWITAPGRGVLAAATGGR